MGSKIAQLDSKITHLENKMDSKIAQLDSKIAQLENKMDSNFAQVRSENLYMRKTLDELKLHFGTRSENYTAAWVSDYVSGITGEGVPSGSYKRGVKFIDLNGIVKPDRIGKKVEVEMDCWGLKPIHAAAEFKSSLSTDGGASVESLLNKVHLFVRKIKFLEDKEGDRPLAFFCVVQMDHDLIEDVKEILKPIQGILVTRNNVED